MSTADGSRIYTLVTHPERSRTDAAKICADEYAGTLANITTYEELEAVNDLLMKLPSALTIGRSGYMHVNGRTEAPAASHSSIHSGPLNFTVHSVAKNGK